MIVDDSRWEFATKRYQTIIDYHQLSSTIITVWSRLYFHIFFHRLCVFLSLFCHAGVTGRWIFLYLIKLYFFAGLDPTKNNKIKSKGFTKKTPPINSVWNYHHVPRQAEFTSSVLVSDGQRILDLVCLTNKDAWTNPNRASLTAVNHGPHTRSSRR